MKSFPAYGRASALAAALVLTVLSLCSLTLDTASAASASTSGGCLPASLKSTLATIRSKFGPVSIVSTYRRGARIAGSGHMSYHASCRAVDFHPPAGKYSAVLAYLQKTHSGGLGTYSCGMHHLHIDNGPKVRFHHCVNASGTPIGKSYASKRRHKRNYASGKRSKHSVVAQSQSKKKRKKKRKTA